LLPHPLGPSPNSSRVGIHKFPFEACSGFTRVTARWIAQPPDGDLCHEASIRPVARPNRSSATRSTDNSPGGNSLHWCYTPSGRTTVEKGIGGISKQHWFKIGRQCAILIQISISLDSFVSNSNSTFPLRWLFRQHRSNWEELSVSTSSVLSSDVAEVPEGDIDPFSAW